MTKEHRQALWGAVNRYAAARNDQSRRRAESDMEQAILAIETEAWAGGFRDAKQGVNR